MAGYLRRSNANAHGAFATSQETDDVIVGAHRAAADLLNADPDEVDLRTERDELLLAISRSVGRTLSPGDEVVVTRLDHDANVRPWVLAAEDAGATVRWVDLRAEDVTLDVDVVRGRPVRTDEGRRVHAGVERRRNRDAGREPRPLVHERTGGDRRVRRRPPRAASADRRPGDRRRPRRLLARTRSSDRTWGSCSGAGSCWTSLRPYKVRPASDEPPDAFETGTQNHEAFAGWIAAVDYLAGLAGETGTAARRARATPSSTRSCRTRPSCRSGSSTGSRSIPGIRLFGIADADRVHERTPTFAIRVGDRHPAETAKALAERGIYVWDGNYYALELMERLGLEETGRRGSGRLLPLQHAGRGRPRARGARRPRLGPPAAALLG